MNDKDWQSELAEMLAEKGHTPNEIKKIVSRMAQYESEMQIDSVMDSIDGGRFDLAKIIEDALKEPD